MDPFIDQEPWVGRNERILLGGILLLAAAIRFYDLQSLPIFTDEAIYLRWASDIWDQKTRAALLIPIADDGKQPLYMWLAAIAMQFIADPLVAGRMVSAAFGVLSVLGMYMAGRWLTGNGRAALLAALFYAVSPFTVLFDRMALVEALLTCCAVWIFALGVLIVRRSEQHLTLVPAAIALGAIMGVAIWTKMTALFLLPFPVICLILATKRSTALRAAFGMVPAYGLFAAFGLLLGIMPNAENLIEKTGQFSVSGEELLSGPLELWQTNVAAYGSWVQAYLPSPLYWLVILAIPWGLLAWRRPALLLLGCWAAFTLPAMLTARLLYTTRYVVPGIFPLLILVVAMLIWSWHNLGSRRIPPSNPRSFKTRILRAAVPLAVLVVVVSPSLIFDGRFVQDPRQTALAQTDWYQYVEGWPSGYGFPEAVDLVKRRSAEIGRHVIVLSDHFHGLPRDGLALYLKGIPNVHFYVDGHIPWGEPGLVEAWRPHQVPILIVGTDGRDDLATLEKRVPEARSLGVFPRPVGKYSYRVYELDLTVPQPAGTSTER